MRKAVLLGKTNPAVRFCTVANFSLLSTSRDERKYETFNGSVVESLSPANYLASEHERESVVSKYRTTRDLQCSVQNSAVFGPS